METQLVRGGRIVVGVDKSDSARAALAWAVRQAGLTGAEVDAVAAWLPPVQFGWAPPYEGPGPGRPPRPRSTRPSTTCGSTRSGW